MKFILILVLKIIVSIGSLYVVSRSIAWVEVGNALKHADYSYAVLALIIFWIAQFFSALRCVFIARVLGGKLDLSISLRAHFVGLWFNQVLPTSLGGDVVKVAMLRKPLGLSVAIRSAILDRISGLMFMLFVTAIALPIYDNLFPAYRGLVITVGIVAVGGWLTFVLGTWAAHCMLKVSTPNPAFYKLIQVFSDAWEFRKKTLLLEQMWTSAIVHFNGIITYALLGLALGINVDMVTFFLVVPIIFIIALFPVSFAGWGVREMGSVWMLGMAGISKELSIGVSIGFGMLLVIAALPGLIVWVLNRK